MRIIAFVLLLASWITGLFAYGANEWYDNKNEGLPNFHRVHPYLYRGGEPSNQGLVTLKRHGIGTIIDLRGSKKHTEKEAAIALKLGLNYINLPMSDKAPTKDQVKILLDTVRDARDGRGKGPVFVHCAHGSDRTGCMIGIWRVTQDDWNYDDAYREMRKYWFTPTFTKLSGAVHKYADENKGKLESVEAN